MNEKEVPHDGNLSQDQQRASLDRESLTDLEKNAPADGAPYDQNANLSDQTTEAGNLTTDCESFEVSWDDDKDPLCPRSMSTLRKWMIVSIACMGSLCV